MKTKKRLLVCLLLASIAVQVTGALPQGQNEQKQIPEGKWVLENVSAFEENVQIPFSIDDISFEIPAEMDIQQDELTFVRKGGTEKVKYDVVVRGSFLCFHVCAECKIVDNKLQLQWGQDIIEEATNSLNMRTIILSYVRK